MRVSRFVFLVVVVLFATVGNAILVCAHDEATDLDKRVAELYRAGRAAEAVPLAKRSLALRTATLQADHPAIGTSLNNIGLLHQAAGETDEAERMFKRAVDIFEAALPASYPNITAGLNNLGNLYQAQGRLDEAERPYKRALELIEAAVPRNNLEIAQSLNTLAVLYQAQGRLIEAEPLFKRALEARERVLPAGHIYIAVSLNNLGSLYQAQGRLTEAEPLFIRALEISERALPAGHPDIALSLNNIANLYHALGRLAEAESLYKRALEGMERVLPPGHPEIAVAASNLGSLYHAQGRFTEAEPLLRRALEIVQQSQPSGQHQIVSLNRLGVLYQSQGRLAEAEQLYIRALEISERALPAGHPDIARTLNNLATLYVAQGRFLEAERSFRRALEIYEKALPADHPDIAQSLNNFAALYAAQGRFSEAEPLLKRALELRERVLSTDHPDVANSLNNLAEVYRSQGRLADAEPLFKRALDVMERTLSADHADVANVISNLAGIYHKQNRFTEAEPLYKRALQVRERALSDGHPAIATSLSNLADLYQAQGRLADAEPLHRKALALYEKALPPGHPDIADSLISLGFLYMVRREWVAARAALVRGTDILIERSRRAELADRKSDRNGEVFHGAVAFKGLVKALYAHGDGEFRHRTLVELAFLRAQWAKSSETAASLSQMAARSAKSEPRLGSLIRERQDLVIEWQALEKALVTASTRPPDHRNAATEQRDREKRNAIDARIREIDRSLAEGFPEYADVAIPQPLTIEAVQAILRGDEALLLFLDTRETKSLSEDTYIWVVTKTAAIWVRSEMGTKSLTEYAIALRCGLDRAAWDGNDAARCGALLKTTYSADDERTGKPLPFDLARAHALYRALFGQVEELIRDKHLLIVPSGPLTTLPFQILVTDKPIAPLPVGSDYGSAAWLAKRHAITVLPSVASLRALRQFAKTSKAHEPFIGFGNPLLTGPDGRDRRAWERQSCKEPPPAGSVQVVSRRVRAAVPKFFRNGLADVEEVRAQYPLPETADELCAVAHSSGAGADKVYLGDRANEKTIKALSTDGTLARVRVLHFATHGLLAGETEMFMGSRGEPALILTPPTQASEEDDGLLTASEIAQLNLDADWVVLSACNTAAGDSDQAGAEALSGLARAFFYAGARALLVSHWAVNSEATVDLVTRGFAELKTDPGIGRAEALRRSMVALIQRGGNYGHPSNWAPFIVVGEGAR